MKTTSIQAEYEKNKLLRKEDIQILQEWAEKQPHLPEIPELQQIFFLHSCYYSMEMAKTTIDIFFKYRTHCPELFANRNPNTDEMQRDLSVSAYLMLPKKTLDDHQVVFYKTLDLDAAKFNFNHQLKIMDMTLIQWLMQEGTAEGYTILADMGGMSFAHIMKLNIVSMKKILQYLQDALPIRLKSIHLFNVGSFVDMLMPLMKPFLKQELINSLHFHTESIESVFKYIPKECFPSDYGGSAPSVKEIHATMKNMLSENEEYFIKEEAYLADESKRVDKSTDLSDIFGVEGSFKKLDID